MLLVREKHHTGFNPMKDFSPFFILEEFNITKENKIFQRIQKIKYPFQKHSAPLHLQKTKWHIQL
jgi:hypothetical protein